MKITPSSTGPRSEAAGASNATGDRKTGAATPSSTAAEQDSIKLSPLSTELAALEASLAAGGDMDTAKVEQIRQAIMNGTLSIDSGAIADKMLAAAQAWLGKKDA